MSRPVPSSERVGIFINHNCTALQRRNNIKMLVKMKEAKEGGCNDVYITRHGILMVAGSNLGTVDAMELKFGVENEDLIISCLHDFAAIAFLCFDLSSVYCMVVLHGVVVTLAQVSL